MELENTLNKVSDFIYSDEVIKDRENALIKFMQESFKILGYDISVSDVEHNSPYSKFIYLYNVDGKKIVICQSCKKDLINYGDNEIYIKLNRSDLQFIMDSRSLKLIKDFKNVFKYYHYIDDSDNYVVNYDNLIHITMIVKDAGKGFDNILRKNLDFVDRWTILDTGSTDDTIKNIKEVLKDKDGILYQEPFINFRESRNRCLDLADEYSESQPGPPCVYNIMLDDTYYLGGYVREHLTQHRCDEDIDSWHIYIRCDEGEYASNRICRTSSKLRYIFTIHEVIQNYDNNLKDIPSNIAHIKDEVNEYMKKRTKDRKIGDIKLLENEIEENPGEPRNYFYMAQTYISLENYEKAVEYYMKRAEFQNLPSNVYNGNREEVTECLYNCGLIGDQHLDWPWEKCEYYLNKCHIHEPRKPDAIYYIGYHYLYKGDKKKAFYFLKNAFELGNPNIFNLFVRDKEIYNDKLPKVLIPLCYDFEDYDLGKRACLRYIKHNSMDLTVKSWLDIFHLLNHNNSYTYIGHKVNNKPTIVFVADGAFKEWNGESIYQEGLGGSETYILEMARNIAKLGDYEVYVYCKCSVTGTFEGVHYRKIEYYIQFLQERVIQTAIISRYSQYVPVTIKNGVENVYLVLHDLTQSGNVLCDVDKYNILCMSEWHQNYYFNRFDEKTNIGQIIRKNTDVFPNGINIDKYPLNLIEKVKYSFIYSSFPNRGLIYLLRMFPYIHKLYPEATLNVFCDLNNEYAQAVAKDEMLEIQNLLDLQKDYITNHGWVSKDVLRGYWLQSEIWLYPCKFTETFCITALEAASSRTLAITNDLGALNNTVSDRGIIIPGDPSQGEWFATLLKILQRIYKDPLYKQNLINKNRKWAESHDWSALAKQFHDKYILKLDYANMLNWSIDIPTGTGKIFFQILSLLKHKQAHILEIGTYTGTSILNMLKILPDANAVVIDKWENYEENEESTSKIVDKGIEAKFYKNVQIYKMQDKLKVYKGDSKALLFNLFREHTEFDFIYVDGSHKCLDCYTDMVISWELLKSDGIMGIDDYLWSPEQNNYDINKPYQAVNHFMKEYINQYRVLHIGYRVFLQKL